MTPARKALAAVILAVLLFAAVVVQLTMVNRLPLPDGAVPDLVLLLAVAIAVAVPPALAAVTGFAAGLALDVAPPAANYAGEYALVFCLAAYAAARVAQAIGNATGERDPVTAFTVMAVAAAAGEAGKAALGMLLSAPDVTTAAVSRVLPGAILYDLLLSPFAFWLVALVRGRAADPGAGVERAPVPAFGRDQRLASVFRQASAGAAPKLRLAGTGAAYVPRSPASRLPRLRFAGTGKDYATQPAAGRVPKLRLSGARSPSVTVTVPGSSGSPSSPLPAGRARKLNFAGDLPVRAGARPARTPGKNWLRETASPAVSGSGTSLAGRRSPRAGWLRGVRAAPASSVKRSPRSGWLGGSRRSRTVIGSAMPGNRRLRRHRGTAGGDWRAVPSSGAWLRRGRGLPSGRRSLVPSGARPMAKTAIAAGARKPRLFGLLGGR